MITEEPRAPTDEQIDEFDRLGQHSLAATLLFRMGIPLDTGKMKKALEQAKVDLPLEPPFTAAKITGALAAVALKIASGELQPAQANALLFALQTLIGAVRVSISEEKWEHRQRKERTPRPCPEEKPETEQRDPARHSNRSSIASGTGQQRRKPSAHPKS
jgi:hypothetical protein